MYLLYVDESGDCGIENSPSKCFVLSGFVIHELKWYEMLDGLVSFRKSLSDNYGFKMKEEFHSARMINKPGNRLSEIPRNDRLSMLRNYSDFINTCDITIFNIVVKKDGKSADLDVFTIAWDRLLNRFQTTMKNHNIPGQSTDRDERSIVICDHTDDKKLRALTRKMRKYNPIPHDTSMYAGGYRNIPLDMIIEDAWTKNSEHSYFIQTADVMAYLLYQYIYPNTYMRKTGGKNYFLRYEDKLCKQASRSDNLGIVYI